MLPTVHATYMYMYMYMHVGVTDEHQTFVIFEPKHPDSYM